MIDYQKELNEEQYKVVVDGDGACLVLAGAGSGKTRTITYRVAYLLEKGVPSENILLVTFTNKAAAEMHNRVRSLTGRDLPLPWSGTFHHIAYKILRRNAEKLGYQGNFSILDSDDSEALIKMSMKSEGIDRKEKRFPSARVIQSVISYARNSERTIEDVLDAKYANFVPVVEEILRVASNYARKKMEANAMDFDDLLVNFNLLLAKSSNEAAYFSNLFQYILVDEYQDTNRVQASIVRRLAARHKNLLVVGDDAQSIYSFRAAEVSNILDFEKDWPGAKIFRLETNYRSTPDILDLANEIIANNTKQYQKTLRAMQDKFVLPELRAFGDGREEAVYIAERIDGLLVEGVKPDEIAVLFRASHHSQALEMELVRRHIPYDYRGGTRFFERAHVKDVLAFLRAFVNLRDIVSWRRILGLQVGIGDVQAEKIAIGAANLSSPNEIETLSHLVGARASSGWSDFLTIWRRILDSERLPAHLIQAVIDSKYREYLENEYPDARERLEDLEQLAGFAEKNTDLEKFLAELSLEEKFRGVNEATARQDKIVLSTVHQAKGLEWEAVFVVNLASGQFPNDRALREVGGIEEERRLFYVAVTRAKKHLHLTYPLVGVGGSYLQGPSMFLEEIDRNLVNDESFSGGNSWNPPESDEVVYEPVDDGGAGIQTNQNGKRSFLRSIDDL